MATELDTHPYRLGFSNGVLHLRTHDGGVCEFHEGADESVTFKVGYNACWGDEHLPYSEYVAEDPLQAELDTYMAGLFPDADLRNYMWRKFASYLEWANREQMLDIWCGVGGNGKTTLSNLLQRTLGDYAAYLPSAALHRISNAASAAPMAAHKKRFLVVENDGEEGAIHPLRIRQLTDGEEVHAHPLFGEDLRFHMKAKTVYICLVPPPLAQTENPADASTKFRLQIIPFQGVFHGPGVGDRLSAWRAPFLSRLVHIYKTEYAVGGLGPTPAIVEERSVAYRGAE